MLSFGVRRSVVRKCTAQQAANVFPSLEMKLLVLPRTT